MKTIRVLSIQDLSCYGQCSLTVALPILSALGIETSVLPTAILSTHTSGFTGYTFRDLKGDLPAILAHWKSCNIRFDAVYTGYLGHADDVACALQISQELNDGPLFVDPAFGDQGVLYGGFDEAYVASMRKLAEKADVLLPNLTEAAFLLDIPVSLRPNKMEQLQILGGLAHMGAKAVVLKGVGNEEETTGILVGETEVESYVHPRLSRDSHGTGDVFASVFVGCRMRGLSLLDAGKVAADFVVECLKATEEDDGHRYGVKFEPLLSGLAQRVDALALRND